MDKSAIDFIEDLLQMKVPDNLPTGGIVGKSEIYDCVTHYNSKWFFGKYGLLLRNSIELPFQPLRGQLGFFETGINI